MSNVTEMPSPCVMDDESIKVVERLLEQIKSGKVTCFAAAVLKSDATTNNIIIGSQYPMHLLGELRILEREVIDLLIDTRCHKASEDY